MNYGPNAALMGKVAPEALATPALLLDRAAFERNIVRMAESARRHGKQLRPHTKAHKCTVIARRQLEAGAIGLCCASLREVEVMAAAGFPGLLLTSPIITAASVQRLRHAQAAAPDLSVVVDSAEGLALLAEAFTPQRPLGVVVEIDVGTGRTGAVEMQDILRLARDAAAKPQLRVRGIQAYYGHLQHVKPYAERRANAAEQWQRMGRVLEALRGAGLAPEIVTGGGTGTHLFDFPESPFTEIQAGSYLFMDKGYDEVEIAPDGSAHFERSLTVVGRDISHKPGVAIIDAGLKAMATDSGPPLVVAGAPAGSTYRFMGDEHGAISVPPGTMVPALGALVSLGAPHCDPTFNLHDRIHVMEGDRLADIWPIDARGY
jgi:D-serine deaminase-like pyridoxal phosphate-dependent protein